MPTLYIVLVTQFGYALHVLARTLYSLLGGSGGGADLPLYDATEVQGIKLDFHVKLFLLALSLSQ